MLSGSPRPWRLCLAGAVALAAHAVAVAQLQPFVLPWNDVSPGVTDLRPWQPEPAGAAGRVTVTADGHYAIAGEQVRFLGVNITSGACFPPHERAIVHAARLARFGVNSVRFHHMEAPWDRDNVIIDYASGSSRQLSADRLDKLHYFVAALAAEGIYSNINLLVSREFQAADGLGAEIAQMGWKDQHILGFFNETALALHREHAANLLTAPNPYRDGLSLAQDPAVAFVEIMNENGMIQKWHEGVLDAMPAVYRAQLAARWNAWLQTRYADTAAMLTTWGVVDEPLGPNLLANGDFAAGTTRWNPERHEGAVASFTPTTDFTGGAPALRIAVSTPGTAGWHVQLNQSPLTLVAGQIYTASFWARADRAVPLSAVFGMAYDPWSTLTPGLNVTLGTDWVRYSWTFEAGVGDTRARLNFNGFGNQVCSVWLADVRFRTGGQVGGLPEGVSLEAGNVPAVPRNPTGSAPTARQQRDWVEFLAGLESAYWSSMSGYVKQTLGYAGIVWGTIVANSAPNVQSALDATDSHAYWQHPQWPAGSDWDPELWTVNNVSMVNDTVGGTLGGLARQRVHGRPHNVTEYRHPSPNTYSSEDALLVAAYGRLQDWDGIWMFDYTTAGDAGSGYITGFFDQVQHPLKMANLTIAAAMFRRGDVARARKSYVVPFTPQQELDVLATRGGAWSVGDGAHLDIPASLALASRVALDIGADAQGLAEIPAPPAGSVIRSDTSELTWDNSRVARGVVTVDTARTKAVIGFVGGRSFDLGGVVIAPGATRQDWCTIGVSLMEGSSFAHASGGRALVVTTGDVENTGMVWTNSARESVGSQWGRAPTLIEVVPATLTLPVAAARVQGWALDERGQRAQPLPVADVGGRAQIALGTSGATLWYEIEIAAGAPAAPVIEAQPMSVGVLAGSEATFNVGVDGWPAPEIRWFRGDQAIEGANGPVLRIAAASAADVGVYHALATNTEGTVRSRDVRLGLVVDDDAPPAEQLVNVSTRGLTLGGNEVMIGGFVVVGTQPRELLIRGVGPTLARWQVPDLLADPHLVLFRHGVELPIAANDSWDPAEIGDLFDHLGAFLLEDPREACLRVQLAPGIYSAHLGGADGGTGTAMIEIYDVGGGDGRVVNLSTRGPAGRGRDGLIVGFVVNGTGPKQVLVRGAGPSLVPFGVNEPVADPILILHRIEAGVPIELRTNDDWEDDDGAAVAAAADLAGAFAFPMTGNDAALLVWLEPGIFTARLETKDVPAVGMVEVYELP